MKLQAKASFSKKDGDYSKVITTFFSKDVYRPEYVFSLEDAGFETVIKIEIPFKDYPPQKLIEVISEVNLTYLYCVDENSAEKELVSTIGITDSGETYFANKTNELKAEKYENEASEPEAEKLADEASASEAEELAGEASESEAEELADEATKSEAEELAGEASESEAEELAGEASESEAEELAGEASASEAEESTSEVEPPDIVSLLEKELEPIIPDDTSENNEVFTFYNLDVEEVLSKAIPKTVNEPAQSENHAKDDESKKKTHRKKRQIKPMEVEWLGTISKSSGNFSEFSDKIATYLGLTGNNKEYFVKMLSEIKNSDSDEDVYSTKSLTAITEKLGYPKGRRPYVSDIVSKKLTDLKTPGTFVPFLMSIMEYKNSFANSSKEMVDIADISHSDVIESKEEVSVSEGVDIVGEEINPEEAVVANKNNSDFIEFEAFPPIPEFETWLATLDYSKPVEQIVTEILAAIGIESSKSKPINNKFIDVAIAAVNMNTPAQDIKEYFNAAGIQDMTKEFVEVRLEFAGALNEFVEDNYEEESYHVKLLDFLKALSNLINKQRK